MRIVNRWTIRGTLLVLNLAICACQPGGTPSPTPGTSTPAPSTSPGSATASFKTQVAPVLMRSCVECHVVNAEFPTLFDKDGAVSWAAARSNITRILDEVRSGRMPRKGNTNPPKLTAQQIADLEAWRTAGTPDN